MARNITPKEAAKGLLRGRFSEATDAFVETFTASVGFDHRLYREDIAGSQAQAQMLSSIGVLSDDESAEILDGLEQIRTDIEHGRFELELVA